MRSLHLRLPDDLHERLKELAEREHRSLNSEIVTRLERSIHNPTARDSPTA